MKSLIDKFFATISRFEFLLLIVPFILWLFCFRHFFTGRLWLEADAVSYSDHITFYANNLSKGIFPLWNPGWYSGAPYDFFLRRIGDVNPLLFLMILFKWLGISSVIAYLIFIGVYFFLAAWAFYLIVRFLLADRFYAFTAYILFLFSSWGSEVFYNYIIIIFVPIIWFFYFLLCFSRFAQKGYLLGMCLCVGLILTTYIPFFFLTILGIFTFLYVLFYGHVFVDFLKHVVGFTLKNKIFTLFCIIFLLVSCIPGLVFYKESKGGEFILPNRHSGADASSSSVAVGMQNVANGDIISHGYFDRLFDDHAQIDMGDIYIPYILFLILLTTICGRINKLIFFLLFNILALSLITVTSAAGVHRFLYEHVIFFKFIRNIYYFFWLAMLPMSILLSVAAFKSLLGTINDSSKKIIWMGYIIACHLVFVLFLAGHQGVLWGAWAAIFISLVYFLIYFRFEYKISYVSGFLLLLLAVFIQSNQVYVRMDNKLFKGQTDELKYVATHANHKIMKLDLYYASRWFAVLADYIDPTVLDNYRHHQFILYDNVVPFNDSPQFFKSFETSIASNMNIAYVSKADSDPGDWRSNPNTMSQADIDPLLSGKLSLVHSDANTWVLKTHLSNSQFLVINDSYNSDWHAFINGQPAHLLRSNVAFKGLWVPSGDSTVLLRFSHPWRYALHLILVAFFAATFLYLLVLLKKADSQMYQSIINTIQWCASRVGVIYLIVFIFCISCVDLKMLDMRIKTRHLNDSIPDFSDMIIFSKDPAAKKDINWKPYKNYFELILSYMSDDVITRQLLGYVDFYSGHEQKAIDLFKNSSAVNGHDLFFSNYNLGVIYYKKGMWAQAAEYSFKAISSSPQLAIILIQNSIVYKQIFTSPFFKYSLDNELKDDQSAAYILLLSSLDHMGQYEKMMIVAKLAIENQNLSYKDAFYYYIGLSFYQTGQMEKAFLFFQKSLSIEKNNPDIYYYIANIYQNTGHLQEAKSFLQVSYELHQKNDPRFPYDSHVNLRFF